MTVFPFLQKIDGKKFLIVGDGSIARRKAELVCQFTDQVFLLTDRTGLNDQNESIPCKKNSEVNHKTGTSGDSPVICRHRFSPSDLENVDYCIASTDNSDRNQWIAELCRKAGIPVNVPDAPALCSFYLPSVLRKGDLTVAVSTDGKSPAFSAHLRRKIEKMLPSDTEEILNRMGELRQWASKRITDSGSRRELYHTILTDLLLGELPPVTEAVLDRAGSLTSSPPGKKQSESE